MEAFWSNACTAVLNLPTQLIISRCKLRMRSSDVTIRRAMQSCLTGTCFSCFGLSHLRRWSVELGVLAALQLLTACYSLCVLLLYMRLDAGRKKFVWNRLGLFSACVTLDLVFGAATTVAAMNNQIWCAAAVAAAARCIQIDQID